MRRDPCASERLLATAVLVLLGLTCAKKMVPPSPDRFPPRLQEVRTRTRVSVELLFDEIVSAASGPEDSIVIAGPSGRLELRGVSQGSSGNRIELWTKPQEPGLYEVAGTVVDQSGNRSGFRARFRGSERMDTIPPRVQSVSPLPGVSGWKRPTVTVSFSEPMDTTATPRYVLVPRQRDTLFVRSWAPDWRSVSYAAEDTLVRGQNVYFLLRPGARDQEGNKVMDPAYTYFTSDSAFTGLRVTGRTIWKQGPLGTGVVFFEDGVTRAFAPVLGDGSFSTRVDSGWYDVVAAADTNADGLTDLTSGPLRFLAGTESLEVRLRPEPVPRPIDEYRR